MRINNTKLNTEINIDIAHVDEISLPMSYRDKGPDRMTPIFNLEWLEGVIKPDVIEFMRNQPQNIERVFIAQDSFCTLLYFDTVYDTEAHIIPVKYWWCQYDEPQYYQTSQNDSWGDLSVISGFEFAAWYMDTTFIDAVRTVMHIMDRHGAAFCQGVRINE